MHPSRMPFMVLMDKLIKSADIGESVLLKFILISPETTKEGHETRMLGPELFPQSCSMLQAGCSLDIW